MAKKLNIFLSRQPRPNRGLYRIFRDGQPTEELVTPQFIRDRLLTTRQFRKFLKGQEIFYVEAEKFRKRNHKDKPAEFSGKSIDFNPRGNE